MRTISAAQAMEIVGVVKIAAGVLVAVNPRIGGLVVAGWLAGIIVSLLLVGGYADIALRNFGLLVGARALSRLAGAHATRRQKAKRRRSEGGGPAPFLVGRRVGAPTPLGVLRRATGGRAAGRGGGPDDAPGRSPLSRSVRAAARGGPRARRWARTDPRSGDPPRAGAPPAFASRPRRSVPGLSVASRCRVRRAGRGPRDRLKSSGVR